MAVAGVIVGEILHLLSGRISNPRSAWLIGDLTRGEGFGLGLLLATFIVAGAYGTNSGGSIDYGAAWVRYTNRSSGGVCGLWPGGVTQIVLIRRFRRF